MKVRTVLQYIADREGAHIIQAGRTEKRADVRIAFSPRPVEKEDVTSLDFIEHWEQFVVDAGMRLLDARRSTDGHPIIAHGIEVPEGQVTTMKVTKDRPSEEKPEP